MILADEARQITKSKDKTQQLNEVVDEALKDIERLIRNKAVDNQECVVIAVEAWCSQKVLTKIKAKLKKAGFEVNQRKDEDSGVYIIVSWE